MLREQVSTLANHQTNGEVSENSSTESSERLENLYKLYRPKHGESCPPPPPQNNFFTGHCMLLGR